MECPICGFDNPEGFRFCGSCGSGLLQSCPECDSEIPPGFKFCGTCGHRVDDSAVAPARPPQAPSERRRVTVLFADLVGFSTLAEFLDPEELRNLMSETFSELTNEVKAREGVVEKFIGDAIVAIFGAPVAHEDDPDRAVETALKMLETVERRSSSSSSPLQLRVGINSGLVVSGAKGDGSPIGVMGDSVNTAARLQQAADRGQILIADNVWRRVRERFETEHVGLLEVKGREQRVGAYRVLGPRRGTGRKQAPFVGRGQELALLELLWSSAEKGNTHVISVVGEPGVGKSRLVAELPRRAGTDIRVTCDSDRAFGPFMDVIAALLGSMPRDVDELKQVAASIGIGDEIALLLGAFLGLAGAPPGVRMADEQQKRQVFAGVWQFLITALGGKAAFIALDDVHWADRSSLELLGFLLERLSGAPLMLVLAYRPGFEQVERTTLRASRTGIRLELLSPEESVALACGFLGVSELPSDLERIVASRAEGNPFFIEELLQALLELGSLAVVDSRAVLAKVDVDIPDTVQGTILARIDRLAPGEKTVLQQAAVLGRTFSTQLIEAIVGDGDLSGSLDELVRAQILVAQGPDQWSFKHALIREVAYDTLLIRQRRDLHRKVAEALEPQAEGDLTVLELLADHFAHAEMLDKARFYAVAAGDAAAERMGFDEAKTRYQSALAIWGEGDPEGRAELLLKLGRVSHFAGDDPLAKTVLIEAEAAWRALGNVKKAGAALARLGRVYWVVAETERAAEVLRRAISLLEPEGPSEEILWSYVWLSTLHMLVGNMNEGAKLASKGLDLEQQVHLKAARSHLLNTLGCCRARAGDVKGVDLIREALELGKESGDLEAIGRGYVNLPESLYWLSRNREGVELCREGRQYLRKMGAQSFAWFVAANEARMSVEFGDYQHAELICREMLSLERSLVGVPGVVNAGSVLSEILIRTGRYPEARTVLDEILPLARRLGGDDFLAPVLVAEADLQEALRNFAAARQAMLEAVEITQETGGAAETAFAVLTAGARILDKQQVAGLWERLSAAESPAANNCRRLETEAWLASDANLFRNAAELYGALELPYEEARCSLEAGDIDRARALMDELGVGNGPLGARLSELSAPVAHRPSPSG
ncbi:MAG: AAA family ATPase [Nocardioidaceae bacterium]|nr:AAA family ATPase [Nocardioidaceae bacterium]